MSFNLGLIVDPSTGKMKLIVAGGFTASNTGIKSSEVFDLETLKWSYGPDLPGRLSLGATLQMNDTFVIIGGFNNEEGENYDSFYEYDQVTNSWVERAEKLTLGRHSVSAVLIPDEIAQCN